MDQPANPVGLLSILLHFGSAVIGGLLTFAGVVVRHQTRFERLEGKVDDLHADVQTIKNLLLGKAINGRTD